MDRKQIFWAVAVLYGIMLFLLLAAWRLPAEKLLPYLAERYSKGRIVVRAERAVLSFPPGYRFEQVSYGLVEGDRSFAGRLRALHAEMGVVRLLVAELPLSFKAVPVGGGMVQGSAEISMFKGLQKGDLEIKASDIKLEEVNVLETLSNRKISGALSGEMRLQGNFENPSGLSGQGRFTILKGSIDTRMDLAGLRAVPFERIRLPFALKEGILTLESVEMEGPMLSGTVSGRVRLNKVLGSSPIELTARLKAGPGLKNNPLAGALLDKIQKGNEQIVLRIGGTIRAPSMNWGGI